MVIEIVPKEDMKNDKMLYIGEDDIKVRVIDNIGIFGVRGVFRPAILPFIEHFKKLIEESEKEKGKGNGKIEIRMRNIRDMMGYEFKGDKHNDNTLYYRLKDTLLEFGVKVQLHHHFGANLIMSFANENEIISAKDAMRLRHEKTALRAGYLNIASYQRNKRSYRAKWGKMEESPNCSLYFGNWIEKVFVSKMFPDAEYNTNILGSAADSGWDFKCKDGTRIKHIASCLRTGVGGDGYIKEYWGWNIDENYDADVFVLTGWKDRKSLELLHAWIMKKLDIVNCREFWNRKSFAINNHKWSLNKYSKFEIKGERLEILRRSIDLRNRQIRHIEREEKMKEIMTWYKIHFKS